MKILVRLPNWLGDMVMSVGAVHQLTFFFPGADVSVIAKKGLYDLLEFFPATTDRFIFSKEEFKGLKGAWKFGKHLSERHKFDLFISFPDSFSSALMGYASGARRRIGYKKEGREILLTNSFTKRADLHRVDEYMQLLEAASGKKATTNAVQLQHQFQKEDYLVVNINSEAQSRRLTLTKAIELITVVRKNFHQKLRLIGGPKERGFVQEVIDRLEDKNGIESLAGKTSLKELCQVLASARLVLTTDSGPAHLANALGTRTIVLFGAGNENNTAPYNKEAVQTVRLGKLTCEPCVRNTCVQFETPQCLELLETAEIIALMKNSLNHE